MVLENATVVTVGSGCLESSLEGTLERKTKWSLPNSEPNLYRHFGDWMGLGGCRITTNWPFQYGWKGVQGTKVQNSEHDLTPPPPKKKEKDALAV